jgi:hypothetical protein
VNIGGKNTGNINTGTQTRIDTGGGAYVGGRVDTGGGDFAGRDKISGAGGNRRGCEPVRHADPRRHRRTGVAQEAPADKQASAVRQVEELKAEIAKGKQADDRRWAGSWTVWSR